MCLSQYMCMSCCCSCEQGEPASHLSESLRLRTEVNHFSMDILYHCCCHRLFYIQPALQDLL